MSRSRLAEWLYRCPVCGFWASTLWDCSKWELKQSDLREEFRSHALESLRKRNFSVILKELTALAGSRRSLCDVGCGHGWFLDAARDKGFSASGIEPDQQVAEIAKQRSHNVIVGCFPECLESGAKFDIISFNDVFEHLRQPAAVLDACRAHLAEQGLLVLNFPSSDGVLYRTALALARFGKRQSLERMWQKSFHSPHVSYFNGQTMRSLLLKKQFELLAERSLSTVVLDGLWDRLRMDGSSTWAASALAYPILAAFAKLDFLFAPDIVVQIYKKVD